MGGGSGGNPGTGGSAGAPGGSGGTATGGSAGCHDDCTTGSKSCVDSDLYQECGNFDADPCLDWSQNYSCSTSWPGTVCVNGYCVTGSGCSDDCTAGAKHCVDGDNYQECGNFDADTCLDWSQNYSCSTSWPGTVCSNGYCVGCTDDCAPGAKHCVDGDNYQECGDFDSDTCLDWSQNYSCSTSWPGTVCSNGYCVNP